MAEPTLTKLVRMREADRINGNRRLQELVACGRLKLIQDRPDADVVRGHAEDLVEARLVEPHELPGKPGRGTTYVTLKPANTQWGTSPPGSRRIHRPRRKIRDVFAVEIRVTEAEEERRRARQHAEFDRQNAAREAEKKARETVKYWPSNAAQYRAREVEPIMRTIRFAINYRFSLDHLEFCGGFHFDQSAADRVRPHIEAIERILLTTPVRFNATDREALLERFGMTEADAPPASVHASTLEFARASDQGAVDTATPRPLAVAKPCLRLVTMER